MEKLVTNKQEQKNLRTYESENAFRNFHAVGLRDLEKKLVEQYFTMRKGRVLDVGCGYGRTTKPLADMGYSVVGIDVVPRMIETARQEYPGIDFRLMSATDLKFPEASFDYVLFSFNGLDCIFPEKRRHEATKEMFRVLKSGGIFILTSHNRATLLTRPRFSSVKMFWRTMCQGLLFTPYVVAHKDGDQILFCRMPWRQLRDYRSVGFDIELVTGKYNTGWLALNLFESWPYFILKKPKQP